MFFLLMSLIINNADARPHRHKHNHSPVVYDHREPRSLYYSVFYRPKPDHRFVWNGSYWMEVPMHYSQIMWIPGHYNEYRQWIPGYYRSV